MDWAFGLLWISAPRPISSIVRTRGQGSKFAPNNAVRRSERPNIDVASRELIMASAGVRRADDYLDAGNREESEVTREGEDPGYISMNGAKIMAMQTAGAVRGGHLKSGQSPLEEIVNSSTHAFGLLLSIGGVSVLVVFASIYGTTGHIVGSSIYGTTLVLLYAASTCYHGASFLGFKQSLRTVEQTFIFLLIAGTYTPFTLTVLTAGWGWSLFGVVWGLSITGIILNTLYFHRFAAFSNLFYLGMGWLCLIAIVPLKDSLAVGGLVWLSLGGVAYTIGIIFLSWNKIPFTHGVWHLSVLVGSACHYFAVLFYVIPL